MVVSLDTIEKGTWKFKISENSGIFLLISFNIKHTYCNARYFESEIMLQNFIDYLVIQTDGKICKD